MNIRKRVASEADGVVSNAGCNNNSKERVRQEAIDQRQPVTANAKESTAVTSHEAVPGQVLDVTANPLQPVISMNLGDNNTNNAAKSNTEGLGSDQTEITTTGGHSAAISVLTTDGLSIFSEHVPNFYIYCLQGEHECMCRREDIQNMLTDVTCKLNVMLAASSNIQVHICFLVFSFCLCLLSLNMFHSIEAVLS